MWASAAGPLLEAVAVAVMVDVDLEQLSKQNFLFRELLLIQQTNDKNNNLTGIDTILELLFLESFTKFGF